MLADSALTDCVGMVVGAGGEDVRVRSQMYRIASITAAETMAFTTRKTIQVRLLISRVTSFVGGRGQKASVGSRVILSQKPLNGYIGERSRAGLGLNFPIS
jgi:hypothetical protein